MLTLTGVLSNTQKKEYAGYRVAASFTQLVAPDAPGAPAPAPAEIAVDVARDGSFALGLPDDDKLKDPLTLRVLAPDGAVLQQRTETVAVWKNLAGSGGTGLRVPVEPRDALAVTPATDPFRGRRGRVRGRVLDHEGKRLVGNRQVVLFGRLQGAKDAAPLLYGRTDASGYFSADYRRQPGDLYDQVHALVSGAEGISGGEVPVHLEQGRLPESVILVVRLRGDSDASAEEDCGCRPEVPRAPDHIDLTASPATYSADLGGKCVNLTMPNRSLEEYSYYTLVRTSDPELYGKPAAPAPEGPYGNAAPGRVPLDVNSPLGWDDDSGRPVDLAHTSQASSVALGHLLHFKQIWRADGYSLGDLLYSLALAPLQKKQIAVYDWEHRAQGTRTEMAAQQEALSSLLSRDRDVSEIVKSTLAEQMKARSEGMNIGGSQGSGGAGSGQNQGYSFGAVVSSAFSVGSGSASASEDGQRSLTSSSLSQLRDRTMQSASAVRSRRSSVVQTVVQGETLSVQTEVVANHNHCHALTMEYFEVLRHFQVSHELAEVRPCLLVPLLMSAFDRLKILRWREALAKYLLDPALAPAFDAVARIDFDRSDSGEFTADLPRGRFADDRMIGLSGALRLTFRIARPQDKEDHSFYPIAWLFLGPILANITAHEFHQKFLEGQRERDRIFQTELAPKIAAAFVDSLQAFAHLPGGRVEKLPVGFSLISDYQADTPLYVTMHLSGTPTLRRADIQHIQIVPGRFQLSDGSTSFAISPGSRVLVESCALRYRTAHIDHPLLPERTVGADLLVREGVLLVTPLDAEEQKNPVNELTLLALKLQAHLNKNIEHYHKAIWWEMDAGRRQLLLDGFMAPGESKRSVASVVENRVVGIVGNSLVMPLAPGVRLDKPKPDEPTDLLSAYDPGRPAPVIRVSVPTRGVFAEAVMGSCNACEVKDETRFWRFQESPVTDQPTAISPVSTDSRQVAVDDKTLKTQAFPAPLVQIQTAPKAPDVTPLSAVVEILKKADLFKDITGLAQTQKGAATAAKETMNTAEEFSKMATGLAKQQAQLKDGAIDKTLQSIDQAKETGLITDEDHKELYVKALQSLIGASEDDSSSDDSSSSADSSSSDDSSSSADKNKKDDKNKKGAKGGDDQVAATIKSFTKAKSGKLKVEDGGDSVELEKIQSSSAPDGVAASTDKMKILDPFKLGTVQVHQIKGERAWFCKGTVAITANGAPDGYADGDRPGRAEIGPGTYQVYGVDHKPVHNKKHLYERYVVTATDLEDKSKTVEDQERYLNAAQIPYLQLPGAAKGWAKPGDFCAVYCVQTHKLSLGVVGAFTPSDDPGIWISLRMSAELGVDQTSTDPLMIIDAHGGPLNVKGRRTIYVVFPGSGSPDSFFTTHDAVKKAAQPVADAWAGDYKTVIAKLAALFPNDNII